MSTTTATKLECTACHDPHGNGQYRILRPVPTDSGYTAILAGQTTPGIVIKDTANKVYTTTNYWIAGDPNAVADTGTTTILGATSILDPTPMAEDARQRRVSSFQANVAAWCTTCHTRYLAPSNSYKTNSGDAIFTYRHTGDNVERRRHAARTGTASSATSHTARTRRCRTRRSSGPAAPHPAPTAVCSVWTTAVPA